MTAWMAIAPGTVLITDRQIAERDVLVEAPGRRRERPVLSSCGIRVASADSDQGPERWAEPRDLDDGTAGHVRHAGPDRILERHELDAVDAAERLAGVVDPRAAQVADAVGIGDPHQLHEVGDGLAQSVAVADDAARGDRVDPSVESIVPLPSWSMPRPPSGIVTGRPLTAGDVDRPREGDGQPRLQVEAVQRVDDVEVLRSRTPGRRSPAWAGSRAAACCCRRSRAVKRSLGNGPAGRRGRGRRRSTPAAEAKGRRQDHGNRREKGEGMTEAHAHGWTPFAQRSRHRGHCYVEGTTCARVPPGPGPCQSRPGIRLVTVGSSAAQFPPRLRELSRDRGRQTRAERAVELVRGPAAQPATRRRRSGAPRAAAPGVTSRPSMSRAPGRRDVADRRFLRPAAAADALDHPLEHAHVLAVARPEELAVGVAAEPVHAEDLGRLATAAAPSPASGRSSRPCCSRRTGSWPSDRAARRRPCPVMAAVVSVLMAEPRKTPWFQSKASKTSGMTAGAPRAEDQAGDRHALRILPVRRRSTGTGGRAR